MGRGNPKSRIMLIGEAPGGDEERTGRVFAGRAGQLLDQYLEAAGLTEHDSYITNMVKCRPPENATPERGHWEACTRYLRREIRAVDPRGILLVGNVALRAVWGRSGITKNRGIPLDLGKRYDLFGLHAGTKVMATIHPAYVLRNPGQSATFAEDLKRFRRYLDGTLAVKDVAVKYITSEETLRKVCGYLAKQPVLSYDVENRYAPWDGKEWSIICLGISADGETSFVIPLYHPDSPFRKQWRALLREHLKPVLQSGGAKLVAQNGKHDNVQLRGAGVSVEHTFDIMLAAHLLDENRPKNLGFLSQTLLGADVYKGAMDLKPEKILGYPIKDLCRYNGYDVAYTRQIYPLLKEELVQHPRLLRLFVKLYMPASHMIQRVEYTGMYINQERLYDRIDKLQGMIDEQVAVIVEGGAPEGINLNSTQQLAQWLFTKKKKGGLGLNPSRSQSQGRPRRRKPCSFTIETYRPFARCCATARCS